MSIALSDLQKPLTRESVRAVLLELLGCLGFPVDSWQDEGNARSLVEMAAALGAEQSKPVAALARMAVITSAEADYLDAVVKSYYDETRAAAVATVLPVRFVKPAAGSTTFAAGKITVQASNGRTLHNANSVTINQGTTDGQSFVADLAGSLGNVGAQQFVLVTPIAGVTAFFDGTLTTAGADAESDGALRSRAIAKWGALRVEKVQLGLESLARNAAPNVLLVAVDDDNPRGPGTVDVYLAGEDSTAGSGDVATVQAALDGALFGTGSSVAAGLAIAAPTTTQNVAATVYIRGRTAAAVSTDLAAAWTAFVRSIPLGGFDLTPGPTNALLKGQIIEALGAVDGVVSIQLATPSAELTTIAAFTKVLEGTSDFTIVSLAG